jgi:hypothetical protein
MLSNFPDAKESFIVAIDSYELAGNISQAQNLSRQALQKWPDCNSFIERSNRLEPLVKQKEKINSDLAIARENLQINHSFVSTSENMLQTFLDYFSGREGVHASQTEFKKKKTGYVPVYEPLTKSLIKQHLSGDKTLGIYLVKKNNCCSLMAIDIDVNKAFLKQFLEDHKERKRVKAHLSQTAQNLQDIAKSAGFSLLAESSGYKGLHLWVFSEIDIPARYWRIIGRWLVDQLYGLPRELSIEIFPKQDKVAENGLGNLVKLPLGIHKVSGNRSLFINPANLKPFPDQEEILSRQQKISREEFEEILGRLTISSSAIEINKENHEEVKPKKDTHKSDKLIVNPANENIDFELEVKIPLPEKFSPEIERILAGCKPLCEIFSLAVTRHQIENRHRHVFIYIFAALGQEGKVFIHQVLNQCDGYDPDALNAQIKAVPPTTMSCGKVRKYLGEIAKKIGCKCQFRLPEGCYASPVVHAGIYPGSNKTIVSSINQPAAISTRELIAGASASIDRLMREYKTLEAEHKKTANRLRILKNQINQFFDENGSNEIVTRIGTYRRLPEESRNS